MSRFKVVVTDYVFPDLDLERAMLAASDVGLATTEGTAENQLIEAAHDADALMVGYAKITRKVIESLERCKMMVRYGIGMDNVDIPAATERGIALANVPDYCVDEVADHTFALLLACARKVTQLDRMVKGGGWDFKAHRPVYRLRGKILGLLGFGRIAQEVARRARGFGLEPIAHDPYVAPLVAADHGVALVDVASLLARSDYLSVHAPLSPSTKGFLGRDQLRMMKPTATVICTSRGGIVDEDALLAALQAGELAGAGLDVLAGEPARKDAPLVGHPNLVITPHCGFYSEEAMHDLRVKSVEEVQRGLAGTRLRCCVNPQVYGR